MHSLFISTFYSRKRLFSIRTAKSSAKIFSYVEMHQAREKEDLFGRGKLPVQRNFGFSRLPWSRGELSSLSSALDVYSQGERAMFCSFAIGISAGDNTGNCGPVFSPSSLPSRAIVALQTSSGRFYFGAIVWLASTLDVWVEFTREIRTIDHIEANGLSGELLRAAPVSMNCAEWVIRSVMEFLISARGLLRSMLLFVFFFSTVNDSYRLSFGRTLTLNLPLLPKRYCLDV